LVRTGRRTCAFKEVREFVISDKGEKVQMLGVSYPKDCMVYKIKLFVVYVPKRENRDLL